MNTYRIHVLRVNEPHVSKQTMNMRGMSLTKEGALACYRRDGTRVTVRDNLGRIVSHDQLAARCRSKASQTLLSVI